MSEAIYSLLFQQMRELQDRVDTLEEASRIAANTEQPLVGPPSAAEENCAALARPVILAKLKTFLEERLEAMLSRRCAKMHVVAVMRDFEKILQWLNELDQGPIAQPLSKIEMIEAINIFLRRNNSQ